MSIVNNLQGGPKGPLEMAIQTAFPARTDVNRVTLPDRPFETYSAIAQEQALLRRAYVDALEAQPNRSYTKTKLKALIQKVAMRLGDEHPPSSTTLYRWHKLLISAQGDIRVLIPRFHHRGGRGQRLGDERLELLETTVRKVYLTLQRRPIVAVYEALLIQISQINSTRPIDQQLKLPAYETIRRYIRALPKYDVALARYGREYARKKYRNSSVAPATMYLLERVEVDHTPLNLFVIDEKTQLVQGRPYVTWMIDCHTRMILGFYLSFSPPSIEAVFRCLKHTISDKAYVREQYPDIQHDWPCYGIPVLILVDNGLEFHSHDLRRATFELGTHYQFCPPRTPWFKPMVERSLRTLAEQFAHLLPGTSFANWFDRYGYDPLKEGIITMSELVHALHVWIIDIYAQSYHRGLKQTPYAAWQKGEEFVTPKTIDPERLSLVLSQQKDRVLGHAGIELHGLRYNGEELHLLRKQMGDRLKVQVRYDPDDLGSINVLHPMTKEPITTPCLTPEYAAGLHLYQHILIQKALRSEGLKATDHLALAKAKAHMQDIVGRLMRSHKLADRKKAARMAGSNSSKAQMQNRSKPSIEVEQEWQLPIDASSQPSTLQVVSTSGEVEVHHE